MRRKDREVAGLEDKLAIIKKCQILRLAMSNDDQPYILPVNFGMEMQGDELLLYIHGATRGKKVDMIKNNPNVCFEMDTEHGLIEAELPQDYSYTYASIIGFGKAELLEDMDQKIHGLKQVMKKITGRDDFVIDEKVARHTMVCKIRVHEFSGKRRPKP